MNKAWVRIVAGFAVLGGSAFSVSTMPVHAVSGSVTAAGACGTTNWDPVKTQNAVTATADSTRPWDEIHSVSVASATSPIGGAEIAFTLSLCGSVPTFPTTTGDAAAEYSACVDLPSGESISQGPTVIGLGHRGGPNINGPFPASQGWKVCAFANVQADAGGNLVSYGVEYFDPIGQYTFFDNSQIKNYAGTAAISTDAASGSTVTLYMPYVLTVQVDASATGGGAKETDETWFKTGDPINNIVAQTQIAATGTLPFPICVNTNPPGISCNNNQLVGPIFGVGGLLTLVDSIPGAQECSTAVIACSNPQVGYDLGLLPIGFPAQSQETCVSDQPGSTGAVVCAETAGVWNTYPCLAANSWPGNPGQGPFTLGQTNPAASKPAPPPYYQDAGEAAATNCNQAVPDAYEYDSEYGRTADPLVPVVNYHVFPTFLPSGFNTTA